jgi:hypothetical protein
MIQSSHGRLIKDKNFTHSLYIKLKYIDLLLIRLLLMLIANVLIILILLD